MMLASRQARREKRRRTDAGASPPCADVSGSDSYGPLRVCPWPMKLGVGRPWTPVFAGSRSVARWRGQPVGWSSVCGSRICCRARVPTEEVAGIVSGKVIIRDFMGVIIQERWRGLCHGNVISVGRSLWSVGVW
jgi:hypothetical protein